MSKQVAEAEKSAFESLYRGAFNTGEYVTVKRVDLQLLCRKLVDAGVFAKPLTAAELRQARREASQPVTPQQQAAARLAAQRRREAAARQAEEQNAADQADRSNPTDPSDQKRSD